MHSRKFPSIPGKSTHLALTAVIAAIVTGLTARAEEAGERVVTMPYNECLAIIAEAAYYLDEHPVTLALTSDLMLVWVDAGNGSVMVLCWRPSNLMVLSKPIVPADVTATSDTLQ